MSDAFGERILKYDGTQEILLEPEIHRNCSAGGGPEYRWRVLDEGGHEALFTNYHAFFSPTLVIHPFYDSHWTKLLAPSVEKASDLVSLQAHSLSPFAVLADGTYTAELTIAENDTIVSASVNTTFSVVAIRLKVVFTDGSAREVDARSNITLQVEVTSPTPDYDIKWGCHLLYNASEGCFPEADPWSKYTNTSDHADTVFDILHRWWEMIHGGGDRGAGDGGPADAGPSRGGPGGARVSPDQGVIRRYYRFQQTITFPASDLRLDPADPSSRRFLFNVTVSYLLRQATAEQLITVAFGRDNFGIRINLSSQIPFGAYRRLVFESECRTCTAEELQDMKYKWNLQMMTSSSFFAYSPPPPVAEVEENLWEALRQGRPPDTFVPRPRDYLRVYNKTDLLLPRDRARGSRPAFPPPEAEGISASDLKKFPAPLSTDLLARARRIFREDGSVDRALWRTLRLDLRSELWKDPAWQQSEEGRRKRDAQMDGGHEFGSGRHAPPPAAQQDLVQKSRSRRAVYPTEQERRRAEVRPAVDSEEGKGARSAKSVGDSSPSRNAPLYPRQITTRQPLPLEDEGHGGPKSPGGHEGRPGLRGGGDRGRDGDGEQETRDYDALADGGMHAGPREHAEAAPGTGGKTAGGARTKLEVLPEEEAGGESSEHFVEEEGHETGEDAGGGGGAATERINGREHQGRDALDTGSTRRRKNLFETNLVRDESEVRVSSLSSASPDDDDEGENASGNSGPKETTGAAVTPDAVTGGGVTPSVTQVRRKAPGETGAGSVTHDMGQASGVDAADTRQEEAEAAPDPREPSGTPWRAGAEGGGSTGGGEDPRRVVVGAGRGEGPGRRLRSSPASPSPRDETAEHHARGASQTPVLSPSNAPDADVGRLPAPRPSPPARRAPAWPADTATAGSRPVSTPGKRLGARDGGGGAGRRPLTPLQRAVGQDRRRGRGAGADAGDAAEPREGLRPPQRSPAKGEPVSVYPPMSWLSRLSAGRGVPQDASPASYPPLPTSSPSTPQVLDYQKYLQMKQRAQARPRCPGQPTEARVVGRRRRRRPRTRGRRGHPCGRRRRGQDSHATGRERRGQPGGFASQERLPGRPREVWRPPEVHILDDLRFTDVVWLTSMTSTGTREPLLVLYVNMLYSGLPYKLSLHTQNPRTNSSGTAQQLIDFSPAPKLKSCRVVASRGGPRFWASCGVASGLYRPLYLQWSYHFLRYGPKTLFYHGTRTSFDFTLPSGLEANDHKMYVSVKALDGKGVASKYQEVTTGLRVEPRFESGDGVLSLFKEISRLENESPPLLLQEVRSLAWELNLLDTTHVSQTVFDNIVALLFYQTRCKDSLETATDESVAAADDSGASILAKVNLLKSCARDHLVELVASLPIRDEMEVMQVLTALEMIVDATEYISSKTFTRVIEAMRAAEKKMGWNYNPEIRTQAAKEYFALTSEVLDKQTEIYDWASSSLLLSIELVELLLKVMEGEIRARFLEEQPLEYPSSTLKYTGYLAETEHLNRWSSDVLFAFNTSGLPHRVHLVQSLEHDRSPYYVKDDPVVSKVVSVDLHMNRDILKSVTVKLPRSKLVTESEYDFRRAGILSPQSLSVYEFEVKDEHSALAFHVLLQVVRILNPDYPVAAVVLICQSLQSLREPLYKEELSATMEAAQVQLSLEPGQLSRGTKLLIIMDKNSYENNWSRQNVSVQGADFKVAAWWSQCLVWNMNSWSPENCSVEGNLSTWDLTTCSCHSTHSTYGARSVPILSEESTIAVNELMLVETFMALYFIVLVLVLYFVMALGLQTSERHRLKRRNIWLRDNDPAHEWAYLLTIKTGTQWNAGTTSKVYAIVHGTHSMSETRELQSKQTGQLFTRGALCYLHPHDSRAPRRILKVQLWHDNSGGSSAGWYVCETSVVDLVLGARYAYPCYRWLAVQAEDAKVEREITLESPTTFFQDFEHFLPQYASEHMLWTSLLTTSSTAKFYRLQRLTICLIVCLCLGTISLAVVQRINTEHTMMVPDMHIEPMYYGCIIAMALLPVQWLLEMVFKMSNRLEEKEYNNKSVLDTLRATRESEAAPQPRGDGDGESDAGLSDEESELYNPNSSTWTALARWAQTVELTNAHLSLLQDKDMDGMHVMQRSRTPNAAQSEGPPEEALGPAEPAARCAEGKARPLPAAGGRDAAKKCSPTIFEFLAELRRAFACLVRILFEGRRAKCKGRARQEDEAGWEADEDDDDDDEGEGGEGRAASSLTFIFSQCVGWIVCCFFAAMCCMVLVVRGSGMPMDYCAVWLHIIYMTLCFSMFVMQPLVVVIYTLYKVCMYRWLGCRGCISDCVTVPLDQVVAIWNRYQTVLRGYKNRTEDMSNEKLLEERQRTRDLRFAHPPSEDYLLRCREKEAQRDKVSSVFRSVLGLLLMLALLVVIASNSNVSERYMLNAATLTTLQNGSCLDREKYPDCCRDSSCAACSEGRNEDYVPFGSIVTKEDWWKWASSELISLAYNSDRAFSQFSVFCDSNSVLIGWPRIRKYDINPEECEAAKYLVSSNRSLADLLHVQSCFPEYVDSVSHVFSFGSNLNKDWDAPPHPQTDLYTTVNLLAEFPSLSGAQVMVRVSSTAVERYKGTWSLVCIMAEVILVAVSMHYLYRTTIYVYKCRLKIWKSFWVFLDILMTILSWSYIVCLMLRVQIAEYIMWQLRVAYFQKYVNLKGLTTWDNILESLIGGMLLVHMIRCMRMMRYLPAFRRLGHVLSGAAKDVLVVTVMLLGMLVCCMLLGYMWFSSLLWEFHTALEAFLTLVRIIMTHVPFLPNLENESNGYVTSLGYLYYLITYILLYQLTRALYKAAFIHAMKSYVGKPGVDVAWRDIKVYAKERCQSLLRFIQRKAEVVDEPKDNTPPDFYMAELELQINQILGGLDNLAESLGIVTERAAQLDEADDEDDDEEFRDSHDGDDDGDDDEDEEEEQPLCERGRDWLAEGFLQGKVKSSTPKTELDVILQPLQKRVQELLGQAESGEREAAFPGAADDRLAEAEGAQDSPFETSFNLDAFTDVASCQTEIEAIARSWNLSALAGGPAARGWAQDDGGQLAKFLKDVSVSAASDESLQAFGKYGKTVGKLKATPRLQPSHESLAAALRSHSTSGASDASRIRSVSSFVDSGGPPQEQAAGRPRSHTSAAAAAAQEGPAHGSSVAMLGSRLRRTQTQGRGKGHVDVLDIESLILDSEEGSEY
ncbi:LOW QUALITY PROTEIN: uncharacterized protein LOC134765858 [Penaeus indicus]|uniref:LOW QUALITY PROTEIN: uncharacterized protein LOC134765858 n=1 Tax=Penaeus indicus TaxID=29960 RepID=UPI00300C922D